MIEHSLVHTRTVSMPRNIKFTIPIRDDDPKEGENRFPIESTEDSPKKHYRLGGAAGIRLAFLCFLLVMVLLAMNHAAKPSSWNWLFQFEKVELPAESADDASTTLTEPGPNEPAPNSNLPLKRPTASDDLENEFWRGLLQQLDGQQQVRLFNLIQSLKLQKDLPAGTTAEMRPIIKILKSYHDAFTKRFDDRLQEEGKFQEAWSNDWLPALESALADRPLDKANPKALQRLSQILHRESMELVRDKTPVDRGREAYAWFSSWAEVFDQPLKSETQVTATVTQLLSQPEAYRGKRLTVEGTALRIERKSATFNALGIEQYYVIWIKPDHPSIYPFCVYTLVAPESLVNENETGIREVDQKVSATGIFFKNRLFNASVKEQSEAAFAPVILTSMVESRAGQTVAANDGSPFPSFSMTLLSMATIATLAMIIALTIYRSTKTLLQPLPQAALLKEDFQKLQDDHRVETTAEKLKRLSASHDDAPQDP